MVHPVQLQDSRSQLSFRDPSKTAQETFPSATLTLKKMLWKHWQRYKWEEIPCLHQVLELHFAAPPRDRVCLQVSQKHFMKQSDVLSPNLDCRTIRVCSFGSTRVTGSSMYITAFLSSRDQQPALASRKRRKPVCRQTSACIPSRGAQQMISPQDTPAKALLSTSGSLSLSFRSKTTTQ